MSTVLKYLQLFTIYLQFYHCTAINNRKLMSLDETGSLLISLLIGSLHVSEQQEVDEVGRNWKLVDLVADWFIARL